MSVTTKSEVPILMSSVALYNVGLIIRTKRKLNSKFVTELGYECLCLILF